MALLTSELCESRGWRIVTGAFPLLDVEFSASGRVAMRVRLVCDDWDALPPSVSFHSAEGTALAALPTAPNTPFNNSAHPVVGRPFLCMVGSREYHTHPSHTGDLWENYRGKPGYDLGGLVTQIWRAWEVARP